MEKDLVDNYPVGTKVHLAAMNGCQATAFIFGYVLESEAFYSRINSGKFVLDRFTLTVKIFDVDKGGWQPLVLDYCDYELEEIPVFDLFDNQLGVIPSHLSEFNRHKIKRAEEFNSINEYLEAFNGHKRGEVPQYIEEFKKFKASYTNMPFEGGMETRFSSHIRLLIENFYPEGLALLANYVLYDAESPGLCGEALRWIAIHTDDLPESQRVVCRPFALWILKKALFAERSKIRCGAVVGLGILRDYSSAKLLKQAIDKEPIKELKQDMQQLLDSLLGEVFSDGQK